MYMKTKILCIATVLCFVLASCNHHKMVDFQVHFYQDGYEIITDTLFVPINSFQNIQIRTYAPVLNEGIKYEWRALNSTPISLRGTDSLRIMCNEYGENILDGKEGTFEWAEFYMGFPDSIFQRGDIYKLIVYVRMDERVLNIKVN